jgi:endonuclease/exonuclease/phosphatase (EEP) superfamily protein YafD
MLSRPSLASLRVLTVAGLLIGAVLTALGLLASRVPAVDIVNDVLPLIAAGMVLVLLLSVFTKEWRLIVAALLIGAINAALLVEGMRGAAAEASSDSRRFLRVATFNLKAGNERIGEVADFLLNTDADFVVLQEMRGPSAPALWEAVAARYQYSAGTLGLVILSKFPIAAEGRIDRTDSHGWHRPLIHWARVSVNGKDLTIAGVHLERPYYADAQIYDVATLTQFVRNQTTPLIVAGDFNMTPWTVKLQRITAATGLKRYNTFHPTWPLRVRGVRLLPFAATDNVLASSEFAAMSVTTGPDLGSDHRPVVADIALVSPGAVSAKIGETEEDQP